MRKSYSTMYSVDLDIVKTSPSQFRPGSVIDLFVGLVLIFIWTNPQLLEAIRMVRNWPYRFWVFLPNFVAIFYVGYTISVANSLILKACIIFCFIYQCSLHATALVL